MTSLVFMGRVVDRAILADRMDEGVNFKVHHWKQVSNLRPEYRAKKADS